MKIQYDNFASKIFDVKIGNIVEIGSGKNIHNLLIDARNEDYQCLLVKIKMGDISIKEMFQGCGFIEVNTQITYRLSAETIRKIPEMKDSIVFREAVKNDKNKIAEIANYSFKLDQFHADANFNVTKSDLFYKQWALNSCEGYADKVFVISDRKNTDRIYAFITLHFNHNESARVGLAAVREQERNKGIFTNLIVNTLNWCNQNKLTILFYGTQEKNIPIIKTMEKLHGNKIDEDCVMHLFF